MRQLEQTYSPWSLKLKLSASKTFLVGLVFSSYLVYPFALPYRNSLPQAES